MPEEIDNPLQSIEQNQTPPSFQKTQTIEATLVNDEYKAKIKRLKNRIIFNLSTSLFFLIFLIATLFYSQKSSEDNARDISDLNSKISELKNKSSNIESRVNEVKKYKQIWDKIDENKKNFSNLRIVDVNDNFNSLADKFGLASPTITMSAPEVLKDGVYNRQSLEVQLVNCTINFQSLTDRNAIDFMNVFMKTVPGYVIINNVSIKKSRKEGYSETDLVDISTGKMSRLTTTKVSFSWYFLKNKLPDITPTTPAASVQKK